MVIGELVITGELIAIVVTVLGVIGSGILGFFKIRSEAVKMIEEREQKILGPIDKLRTDVTASINQLRSDMTGPIEELGEKVDTVIAEVEELDKRLQKVQSDMDQELYPRHEEPLAIQVKRIDRELQNVRVATGQLPEQLRAIGNEMDGRLSQIEGHVIQLVPPGVANDGR